MVCFEFFVVCNHNPLTSFPCVGFVSLSQTHFHVVLKPWVGFFGRSLVFHDFVAKCLTKEPRLRPTASEMLKVWWKILLPTWKFCRVVTHIPCILYLSYSGYGFISSLVAYVFFAYQLIHYYPINLLLWIKFKLELCSTLIIQIKNYDG